MTLRRAAVVMLAIGCAAAFGCSSDDDADSTGPPSTLRTEPLVVQGAATLDGAPLAAEFLGAVVRRDGLITPCQADIPSVSAGRFEISVLAEGSGDGCGSPGGEVLLWTFANGRKLYSTAALPWPQQGGSANFDARFATATPNGDAASVTELSGEVFDPAGKLVPVGTRVEAYVDTTLCGVASVRQAGDSFTGYIMSVVGPESVPGCARDAEINFRIDGRPAVETYANHLEAGATGSGASFPLTQS